MERPNSSVLVETGPWTDIASFCSDIAAALDGHVPPETRSAFDTWRPHTGESADAVRVRTVDDESLPETRIERESDSAGAEFREAGHDIRVGGVHAIRGAPRRSVHDLGAAGSATARGIIPTIIRVLRRIEHRIYASVVSRTNPDYFESGPFTATLRRGLRHRDRYEVRIDFADPDVADAVVAQLGGD